MSILPVDTVQAVAESAGLVLRDTAAAALVADVEYRLREIVHEAKKFMRHAKRTRLMPDDINHALRLKNVEPLYGHSTAAPPRFRSVAMGPQRLFYLEDQEVDLEDIIYAPLPSVPLDVTYTDLKEALVGARNRTTAAAAAAQGAGGGVVAATGDAAVLSGPDGTVNGQVLVKSVLSRELQTYYDRVTESALAEDATLASVAVASLQEDTGIQPLLPYLVQFMTQTASKRVRDLHVMWAVMRMANAILKNRNLFVQPYLHHLIPVIMTGVVSKRIGDADSDHHALRSFAAQLLVHVCRVHGPAYPSVQPRATRTLLKALLDPDRSLATRFGAAVALAGLGDEAAAALLVPNARAVVESFRADVDVPPDAPPGASRRARRRAARLGFKTRDAQKLFEALV
ncbi:Transcription initiation factor TFIID subunit 6, partial [Cladochytrium tenue]